MPVLALLLEPLRGWLIIGGGGIGMLAAGGMGLSELREEDDVGSGSCGRSAGSRGVIVVTEYGWMGGGW